PYYTFSTGVKPGRIRRVRHVARNRGLVMAFNPFHAFRKHQKVIFAIMTIICMIVFVFQFGMGDPFTRVLGWLGASRGRGQVVATIYGSKVYETDLDRLRQDRETANNFIAGNVYLHQREAINAVQKQAERGDPQSVPPAVTLALANLKRWQSPVE